MSSRICWCLYWNAALTLYRQYGKHETTVMLCIRMYEVKIKTFLKKIVKIISADQFRKRLIWLISVLKWSFCPVSNVYFRPIEFYITLKHMIVILSQVNYMCIKGITKILQKKKKKLYTKAIITCSKYNLCPLWECLCGFKSEKSVLAVKLIIHQISKDSGSIKQCWGSPAGMHAGKKWAHGIWGWFGRSSQVER